MLCNIDPIFLFNTGQAEDSERKSKELDKSVFEFQTILKEASHRYGALEDQYEKDKEGRPIVFDEYI